MNTQDHQAAPRLLRDVLKKELPQEQERRFSRLLGRKDESQYRGGRISKADAQKLFNDLDAFAAWVESLS